MVARLIQFGHNWSEIKNYTLEQINLFYQETFAVEGFERANRIEDMAIGSNGTKESIIKVTNVFRKS
ncbi:MAG: hypothetical protein ACI3ZR_05875 [bacterium]